MLLHDLYEAAALPLRKGQLPQIRGSYAGFIISIAPMDFLRLTTEPSFIQQIFDKPFPYKKTDYVEYRGEDTDYGKFDLPFLNVEFPTGQVKGHEGRHRAVMVMRAGGTRLPVVIYPRGESRYDATYSFYDAEGERRNIGAGSHPSKEAAELAQAEAIKTAGIDPDDVIERHPEYVYGRTLKGEPSRSEGPWEHAAWRIEDFPKQLVGQYDSTVVTDFRVGLVKGYRHFKH